MTKRDDQNQTQLSERTYYLRRSWPLAASILSVVFLTSAVVNAARVDYIYDEAGRLRTAVYGGCTAGKSVTYTLDAAGNRRKVVYDGGSTQPGILQFYADPIDVNENGGTTQIEVTRCGSGIAVSVSYVVEGGSATQGNDYSLSGTLSWAATDTAPKYISFTPVNDASTEGLETVTILLNSPQNGAIVGAKSRTTVRIADDDVPIPYLSVAGMTLSWPSISGASHYEVWDQFDNQVYQGAATSHVADVPMCSENVYRVRACSVNGCGGWSNPVSIFRAPPPNQQCEAF